MLCTSDFSSCSCNVCDIRDDTMIPAGAHVEDMYVTEMYNKHDHALLSLSSDEANSIEV